MSCRQKQDLYLLVQEKSPLYSYIPKTEKRRVSPDKTFAHLTVRYSNIVSPSMMMVAIRNKRQYNNNVVHTISGKVTLCTSINSKIDVKTKSSSKQSSNLKKKAMQCLVGVASPPNEKKKKCFIKLVQNDDCAVTILDMAIEIGSSVENTKDMLMNNCI